jgi:hypothetical protein
VNTDAEQHSVPSPEAGKALVVFLQDDFEFNSTPKPTTRFGVDGIWVGATHANSYFYVPVDPGEHHLCASWQSSVTVVAARSMAAAHFTAQARKTYYFRARDMLIVPHPEVELKPLDSDEAMVLLTLFAFSRSHPK